MEWLFLQSKSCPHTPRSLCSTLSTPRNPTLSYCCIVVYCIVLQRNNIVRERVHCIRVRTIQFPSREVSKFLLRLYQNLNPKHWIEVKLNLVHSVQPRSCLWKLAINNLTGKLGTEGTCKEYRKNRNKSCLKFRVWNNFEDTYEV